ncbi:MAG: OpgC domain-containing protein, partial [Limisphaerales bacterium]
MAAVHVPTLVSHFLHEPLGFMSDAEGFIFLSACLAGLAYGKMYRQTDWSAMSRRVWHRARQIYLIHLAVILPVVLMAWVFAGRITPLANHFHDFLVHPWGSLALIPLLLHQPPLFDILPLYIILLSVTPLLLALARRRGWGIVLAVSA